MPSCGGEWGQGEGSTEPHLDFVSFGVVGRWVVHQLPRLFYSELFFSIVSIHRSTLAKRMETWEDACESEVNLAMFHWNLDCKSRLGKTISVECKTAKLKESADIGSKGARTRCCP